MKMKDNTDKLDGQQLLTRANNTCPSIIENASEYQNYAINVFLEVWHELELLYNGRQHFALGWLLKDDCGLEIYVNNILQLDVQFSRKLLFNGYYACRALSIPTLSPASWAKVHVAFAQNLSFSKLPRPIRRMIRDLRSKDRWELLNDAIAVFNTETSLSREEILVKNVPLLTIRKVKGFFLGDWNAEILNLITPEGMMLFKHHPTEFFVIKKTKNCTFFFDRSKKIPVLIAMIMQQKLLEPEAMNLIRSLLEHLFLAHPAIMRGVLKRSYKGQMTGFGPMCNRFEKYTDLVSFFCHVDKLRETLPSRQNNLNVQFEQIIDRFGHGDLVEIILGLYLWWCPELVRSFFLFSKPYFESWQYDQEELEKHLDGRRPTTYQLYILKDYCSKMHRDSDSTEFTLCYASHPDSEITTPIDFVIPEYSIRIPVDNSNLLAFRSSVVHGTGYRVPTANAAYMGCIIVNNGLNGVMRRRQGM